MRIVVVGAGIGGSCLARLARERGHEVDVVALQALPDSLAATAVLRRGYHKGEGRDGQLEAWDYALQAYERWGVQLNRGAQVSSYRRLQGPPKADDDWILLDPAAPLVQPDIRREVVSAHGGNAWYAPGRCITGDAVVAACGAAGQLAPPGAQTWGVTWVHAAEALREPGLLRVYQYAPYRTLVAGVTGLRARVGSSSALSRERAVQQGHQMLETAWHLGWLTTDDGWEMRLGARLRTERLWWREADGHWRLGGFHRTGYALAPAAARDLLTAIEKDAQPRLSSGHGSCLPRRSAGHGQIVPHGRSHGRSAAHPAL